MTAYYNEFDPFAAEWLRELIKAGVIAPGVVDDRSILDVTPQDLKDFNQCHFFAGIGVWSYALRQAGWDDSRPVWTGSCPCQPFSAAGSRAGFADERHLWPAFHYLIEQCRPGVVFGEQVASKDGRTWLDHVQADMENLGFAIGAGDICAAGFGAPHIRQRLYFVAERVADTVGAGSQRELRKSGQQQQTRDSGSTQGGRIYGLEHARHVEYERDSEAGRQAVHRTQQSGGDGGVADTSINGCDQACECESSTGDDGTIGNGVAIEGESATGPTNGFWRAADWLFCRDDKWRPVEVGTHPLVSRVDEAATWYMLARQLRGLVPGRNRRERRRRARELAEAIGMANGADISAIALQMAARSINRVGQLRGYGNAINAQVAQAFIEAYLNDLNPN